MRAASTEIPGVAFAGEGTWNGPEGPASRLKALRIAAETAGLDALSAAEALAVVLAPIAGTAAEALAAQLLARFGSLGEVLGAPAADLERVAGRKVAAGIVQLHALQVRALREPFRRRPVLTAWSQVAEYLRAAMAAAPREQFRVLFLDRRNQLIADEVMGQGTVDHAPVYPREVMRRALELHASAIVLAHNHPSGDPTPSAADIDMTRQVVEAARWLKIAVHDHLVVGAGEVASFRRLGLI